MESPDVGGSVSESRVLDRCLTRCYFRLGLTTESISFICWTLNRLLNLFSYVLRVYGLRRD